MKEGEEIEAKIIKLHVEEQKIGLSLKENNDEETQTINETVDDDDTSKAVDTELEQVVPVENSALEETEGAS